MKTKTIWLWISFALGLALFIPGIVLLEQSNSCDDDCENDADIPLTVFGAILIFIAICGYIGSSSGSSSSNSGQPIDPVTRQRIIDNGNAGAEAGNLMAQQNAAQAQWQQQQQNQMQWSINNPV